MFIDRIDKETTDISRAVLDMSWWLDAGETLTTVVSSKIITGMFGWSEPPYPPLGDFQPADLTPLLFDRPVVIDSTGTQLIVYVKIGSPGVAYTCQFVLDGSSTRRVTVELGVQVTGIPIGSAPGPIPSWLAVTVSDTAPPNPQCGQLWFDSVNAQLYLYYCDPTSSEWVIAVADIRTGMLPATVTISDQAPADPKTGQLWFDSVGAELYVWYVDVNSPQWVSANTSRMARSEQVQFLFTGKPVVGYSINVPITMNLIVPPALAGTLVYDKIPATAHPTFIVNRLTGQGNETAILLGAITIAGANPNEATTTGPGGTLVAGEVLQIVAPTPIQDPTLSDVSITVLCSRA